MVSGFTSAAGGASALTAARPLPRAAVSPAVPAPPVELVGDAGGHGVVHVAEADLEVAHVLVELAVPLQVVDEVAALAHPGGHADGAVEALAVVARVLERLPGALEEEPLLRVEDLRLARGVAEEGGVEQVGPFDARAGHDRVRPVQEGGVDPRLARPLLARDPGHRLPSGPED